tara:strand:+ start:102 stop:659 length:558 start_codon:yes stop_codon:yes gene_type:complete
MIASLLSRIGVEVWKDIPTFEKKYQVSNLGNVRSLNYNRMGIIKNFKKRLNNKNRYCVNLRKDKKYFPNKSVSQLVAMAFLNHKPCGYKLVVDHIDNNKNNDKLYNLQIITHRLNCSKDRNNGSSKYVGVVWDKKYKKFKAQIKINKKVKHLGYFKKEKEAAQAYQNELKKINESKEAHTDTTHT